MPSKILKKFFFVVLLCWVSMAFMSGPCAGRADAAKLRTKGFDIPVIAPLPPNFPKTFPAYTKCWMTSNGVQARQACYDKEEVRQLLTVWRRHAVLMLFPPLALQMNSVVSEYAKAIESLQEATQSLRKALTTSKGTIATLREKIKRDEKRLQNMRIKYIIIATSVGVLAVAVGVVVGYGVARAFP